MNLEQINPHLQKLEVDHLFHLGIDTSMDLASIFAEIKYVVLTRTETDVAILAKEFAKQWYNIKEDAFSFNPIFKSERFQLYTIGAVLIVSHGVGMHQC